MSEQSGGNVPKLTPRTALLQPVEDLNMKKTNIETPAPLPRRRTSIDGPSEGETTDEATNEAAKICNGNCPCQNFRSKNSFKSDVALKHAPDERPVKKADQKSEIAPRERRREEKT